VKGNSTHRDYEASALERFCLREVLAGGDPLKQECVKRFPQTIFSGVFEEEAPIFAVIRMGFLGQAVRRKTRAIVHAHDTET
jgi:hypothetical protein